MLQVRAAIADTKWRANTVWNWQIRSQLPVTAVPPPPDAPGRGGGNTRWLPRWGGEVGAGVFGVLVGMLGQGMSVCRAQRVALGATCDGHELVVSAGHEPRG